MHGSPFCMGVCRREADRNMAKERGPSKAEVALLAMDKKQLKQQMMKAVRD